MSIDVCQIFALNTTSVCVLLFEAPKRRKYLWSFINLNIINGTTIPHFKRLLPFDIHRSQPKHPQTRLGRRHFRYSPTFCWNLTQKIVHLSVVLQLFELGYHLKKELLSQ